jgi:hypothetical protein
LKTYAIRDSSKREVIWHVKHAAKVPSFNEQNLPALAKNRLENRIRTG